MSAPRRGARPRALGRGGVGDGAAHGGAVAARARAGQRRAGAHAAGDGDGRGVAAPRADAPRAAAAVHGAVPGVHPAAQGALRAAAHHGQVRAVSRRRAGAQPLSHGLLAADGARGHPAHAVASPAQRRGLAVLRLVAVARGLVRAGLLVLLVKVRRVD
ncbi:fatty acid elongase [Gracilaria domingensis]|nr:fatty acid elongase [Gracilaria domingensis]